MTSPKADIAAHRPGELIACFLAAEKWRSGPFEGLCWSPTALSLFLHHLHLQVFCNLRLIPREILSSFVLTPVPHLKKKSAPFHASNPTVQSVWKCSGPAASEPHFGKAHTCLSSGTGLAASASSAAARAGIAAVPTRAAPRGPTPSLRSGSAHAG